MPKRRSSTQDNSAKARAGRWSSKDNTELSNNENCDEEGDDDDNEDEEPSEKSARHVTAGKIRAGKKEEEKRRKSDSGIKGAEARKKMNEITAEGQAQEAIKSMEYANEAEDELQKESEIQFDNYNAAMNEGGVEDPELDELKKENTRLREKQRLLTNEKKAMKKRMTALLERETKKNKNMQKMLQRRPINPVRKAKKSFTELKSRDSRNEAIAKFMAVLTGIFTCYTALDFWSITRKAWPDTFINNVVLSPPETWQFMCFINVSFTKMRAIRKYLKSFKLNIFSSEGSVYSLIKNAAHSTITKVCNIAVNGIPLSFRCAQVRSLRDVIKERVTAQIKGGRFPKNCKILRLCIGFDKGGTTTKMGLMMGSIKGRNGPRGMSLLALYEGNESPAELMAAFGSIIEECKNIKMIQIGDRKIYVSFRFTGDLKCLKACLGLKAGSAKYPCLYCMQEKEKNFGTYSGAGWRREHYHMDVGTSTGQGHTGCLSWISPEQIVVPSLHLLMGVAESLIDHLISRIITKKAVGDFSIPNFSELREKNNAVVKAREELENEREKLNSWKTIAEKLRSCVLPIPEARYPDDIDETNAEEWMGEVCGCSTCVAEVTDLVMPSRHSTTVTSEVPDWIWSDVKKMWFHSICLGLTADQSRTASADIEGYDPRMASLEVIATQINAEIEWSKIQVHNAEKQLDETLSKLNLPKEVTDLPAVNAFFKIFEKFGAYRTLWFQRFTGNHIHLILKSMYPTEKRQYTLISKIMEEEGLRELLETDGPEFDEQFSQGLEALKVLGDIQNLFCSKTLSGDEIQDLKSNINLLKNIMSELKSVKVSHKFHLLLEHVPEVAERDLTVGFFSEHGLESLHAHVNALLKRLTVRKNENKMERILQLVNAATVNRDEHGDLLEMDEEEEDNELVPFPNDDILLSTDPDEEETIFIDLDFDNEN